MATLFDTKGKYYVRFKDAGKWKQKCIGRTKSSKKGKSRILSKEEAEHIRKVYDSRELKQRDNIVLRDVNISPSEAIDIGLKEEFYRGVKVNRLSAGTRKVYEYQTEYVRRWLEDIKIKNLSQLKMHHINDYPEYCKGLADGTIELRQKVMFRFLRWADKRGYWNGASELSDVKRIKKVKEETPDFLSLKELHKVFGKMGVYEDQVRFMYYTGSRVAEVGNFRWSDYNADIGMLTYRIIPGTKTKRVCKVYICEEAKKMLAAQRKKTGDQEHIFYNRKGDFLTADCLGSSITKAFRDLGDEKHTSHILRHTFASQLAIAGVPIIVIMHLLRHSTITQTMVYAKINDEAQIKALKKLPI